jgi:VanZ family protein
VSVSPHSGGTVPDLHRIPSPLAVSRPPYHRNVAARPPGGVAARISAWLPVVAWAAIIFAFSSIPSLESGLGTWDLVLRKLAHMVEYAILAGLFLRALGRDVAAFAATVVYAASDEIHQHFVSGRHGSVLDVLLDAVGAAAGLLVAARLRR